ncbi:MAG: DUF763 domain-containing protein [Candidatus Micrarchaeaceae archaeon]
MRFYTFLPLHGGKAPRWLFSRMVKLGGEIATIIMDEFGPDEFLRRISDPMWFQALSCAMGYDWHSSGTTTVTMGALKEALNESGDVYIAGGKGKQGVNTPAEIEKGTDLLNIPSESANFIEHSRLAAKIDSAMVYDRLAIYHHTFVFSRHRKWAVVQQAMECGTGYAVRFQWLSENVEERDIANEPHTGIQTTLRKESMDLTSADNAGVRRHMVDAIEYANNPIRLLPSRHRIIPQIDMSRRAMQIIQKLNEININDYKELLLINGVGRSTIRTLAFISSLVYNEKLAYRDPAMYAYNLGGKDGIPFRVNRAAYDSAIESLKKIIDEAHLGNYEKLSAFRRLDRLTETAH